MDFAALRKAVSVAEGLETRSDQLGLRCALGTPGLLGAHAHFSASLVGKAKACVLEFELVRGSHAGSSAKSLTVQTFFEKSMAALKVGGLTSGLLSCHYSLDLEEWLPPVPLPFSAPMTVGNVPGKATVAGFDFTFPEIEGYGMKRLFVTTYENSKQLAMRLLLSYPPIWGQELPNEMIRAATSLRDQLVVRRK